MSTDRPFGPHPALGVAHDEVVTDSPSREAHPLLSDVLDDSELPLAELHAAVLDGELFPHPTAFSPLDVIDSPALRAATLRSLAPLSLIAERMTAAWVWGATTVAPWPPHFCAPTGTRTRAFPGSAVRAREVSIEEHEVMLLGSVRVTGPLRTALDLLRVPETFDARAAACVADLLLVTGIDGAACAAAIDSHRRLPHRRRAAERLGRVRALLGDAAPLVPGARDQPAVIR